MISKEEKSKLVETKTQSCEKLYEDDIESVTGGKIMIMKSKLQFICRCLNNDCRHEWPVDEDKLEGAKCPVCGSASEVEW